MDTNNSTLTGPSRHYDSGEVTWILACISITWIMVPGVGFLYSGMARSKSALSLIILCFWSCAVVSLQWYLIGSSLCLSNTGGPIIGNIDHMLLRNIGDMPSAGNPKVPTMLVSVWYCLFAVITPTIILGAIAERTRLLPTVVFIFCWSTLVFDFLTYWTWNPHGWTYKLGALDYGGGTPVHISTGAAALSLAYLIGKRQDVTDKPPHNMSHIVLGTSFIWLGWLVANAGSGLSPNLRAVTVFITTNMSAAIGGITWSIIDYFRHGRKWSALGFCCGAISGLVAITPASGYVSPSSSLVFGVIGAISCNLSMGLKGILRVDDTFDVFCVHGIGGIVGNILTGIFAQKSVAGVDGTEIQGGWLDEHWEQVGIQALDTLTGFGWSFICTSALYLVINIIPGLHFRCDTEVETSGLDNAELGISMYEHFEEFKSTLPTQKADFPPSSLNGKGNINHGLDMVSSQV